MTSLRDTFTRCPNCGYDIRAATAPRCSECGVRFKLNLRKTGARTRPTVVLIACMAGWAFGSALLLAVPYLAVAYYHNLPIWALDWSVGCWICAPLGVAAAWPMLSAMNRAWWPMRRLVLMLWFFGALYVTILTLRHAGAVFDVICP